MLILGTERGRIDAQEGAEVERIMTVETLHSGFLRKVLQSFLRLGATALPPV